MIEATAKRWSSTFVLGLLICMSGSGCAVLSTEKGEEIGPRTSSNLLHVRVQDLAGAWEFVAGDIAYTLFLDQKGNGTYEWKDGRLETTSVTNGLWKGTWHQSENDREGRFTLHLADDVQTAQGEWWYTRIGNDHDPLDPGGSFTMKRISTPTNSE